MLSFDVLRSLSALLLICGVSGSATAAPEYDFDRPQLEAVLADLAAWLPGEWSSFPQVWYDRNVAMPADGEHEHWHRSFALIEAPQVGETVFYGQINIGGPEGPVMARSQVLYKAYIDDDKGVVTILGQPIVEPDRFVDLHRRPELWKEARMPDEASLHCRFDWRRHGRQLVGTLDNIDPETGAGKAPGTCVYTARNGMPFLADAEWVLSEDELWLYDINIMGDVQFIGRKDRTHLRLYRVTGYRCDAVDARGERTLVGHDRGFAIRLQAANDEPVRATLLRAWYPAEDTGLTDELRLSLSDSDGNIRVTASGPTDTARISASFGETRVTCTRAPDQGRTR